MKRPYVIQIPAVALLATSGKQHTGKCNSLHFAEQQACTCEWERRHARQKHAAAQSIKSRQKYGIKTQQPYRFEDTGAHTEGVV